MNRIILIGNGFDLAHGLKTRYADFIDWYWRQQGLHLLYGRGRIVEDGLCLFKLLDKVGLTEWFYVWGHHYLREKPFEPWDECQIVDVAKQDRDLCDFNIKSVFFETICNEVEKGWVDIEDVYYTMLKNDNNPKQLNDDLDLIKGKLIEYLIDIQEKQINSNIFNSIIQKQILEPFHKEDIAINFMDKWNEMLKHRMKYDNQDWNELIKGYVLDRENVQYSYRAVEEFIKTYGKDINDDVDSVDAISCSTFRLPDNIMLLNFNYTNTADMYLPNADKFSINHIHGTISNPDSVIFGYGDERDDDYNVLMRKNDNEYLRHIKSFRYLEARNYREMLSFIESAPYQICIMGHSCGLSDRTLLATLFEHENCVSIKPYYYKKEDGTDNYRELVQNIARNFKDPSLMRDRVVRKDRCEALGQKN